MYLSSEKQGTDWRLSHRGRHSKVSNFSHTDWHKKCFNAVRNDKGFSCILRHFVLLMPANRLILIEHISGNSDGVKNFHISLNICNYGNFRHYILHDSWITLECNQILTIKYKLYWSDKTSVFENASHNITAITKDMDHIIFTRRCRTHQKQLPTTSRKPQPTWKLTLRK